MHPAFVIILSLICCALAAGMEIAFVSSNKLRIALARRQGRLNPRIVSFFVSHSSRFIATMLVANTIALTSERAIEADPGIAFRARRLRQAEAVWRANPLVGGGPGVTFGQDVDWTQFETTFVTFIDNSWTYPTAVGGLVGMSLILLCYACFIGGCIYAYIRLRHPFHRALAVVPLAHMAWLLVCSPVNWWMVDRYHVAAFSFAVGLVYALVYYEKVNGSEKPVIEVGD